MPKVKRIALYTSIPNIQVGLRNVCSWSTSSRASGMNTVHLDNQAGGFVSLLTWALTAALT